MAAQISTKRIIVWLAIAFVIVGVWQDPGGQSQEIGNFLGDVGHFLMELITKFAAFLSGLG